MTYTDGTLNQLAIDFAALDRNGGIRLAPTARVASLSRKVMRGLDQIGVEYNEHVNFEVSSRMTRAWGNCQRKREVSSSDYIYVIKISERLLEEGSDEGVCETICHELLHTVDGCMNHGRKWQSLAAKVHRELGYNVKRTNDAESKGVANASEITRAKYVIRCTGCGMEIPRVRMSEAVRHPENYLCGKCNSPLKRVR